ncbi:DUF2612 domain-containing protein [Pectinatus frisingensis]|uniref:DUF2612 domain-containing protein n=1 Tax=Pectinatus frisingensis TaxID=865 RepID=UPI0018C7383B
MSRYGSMINHTLAQYDNSTVMQAAFYAVSEELELIDTILDDLKNKRWIDTGVGTQLDGIGTIVDRSRLVNAAIALEFFGFYGQAGAKGFGQARFRSKDESYLSTANLADPEYRLVLWSKVFKNNSLTYANDTIKSLQFIFDVDNVIVQDAGNAKFMIGIGKTLSANEILLANALDLLIRAGGVGCQFMSDFDGYAFGFKGQKYAKGFGQAAFASTFYN